MRTIGIAVVVATVAAVALPACGGGGGGSSRVSPSGAPSAGAVPTKPVPPGSHSPATSPGARADRSHDRSEPRKHEHKDQAPVQAAPTHEVHKNLKAPAEARPIHKPRPAPAAAAPTPKALERLAGSGRSGGRGDAAASQGVEVTSDQAVEVLRQLEQEARETAKAPDGTEDPVERIIGELSGGSG